MPPNPWNELRDRLIVAIGESSVLADWLASDMGDTTTARNFYQTAEQAAKEAGDPAWPPALSSTGGHCCVASSLGQRRHDPDVGLGSNAEREVVECHSELVTGGDFGGDLVVAAAQILHEGMTGG
jgi:hypothetical protein